MSFMNILNTNGPELEHCGIPLNSSIHDFLSFEMLSILHLSNIVDCTYMAVIHTIQQSTRPTRISPMNI